MNDRFATIRDRMVQEQLIPRGISDARVLAAMREVPRHCFVDDALRSRAYGDFPLPIASGQTISQPYIVALMTDMLQLEPGHRVLEIGTGSGYQTAILSLLCERVYTMEVVQELSEAAASLLKRLGYHNIETCAGSGYDGWAEHAPYDGGDGG